MSKVGSKANIKAHTWRANLFNVKRYRQVSTLPTQTPVVPLRSPGRTLKIVTSGLRGNESSDDDKSVANTSHLDNDSPLRKKADKVSTIVGVKMP